MNYTIQITPRIQEEYTKCTIQFKNNDLGNNISLVKSIIKSNPLLNVTVFSKYEKIQFMCRHFISLHQYISELPSQSYSTSYLYKIMYDLTCQYKYLVETEKKTFIGFHPDHIYVIDHNTFIYLQGEHLCSIDTNKQINITCPFFTKSFFYSPELFTIQQLPQLVHYKCAYYSLAILFIYIHLLKTQWVDYHSDSGSDSDFDSDSESNSESENHHEKYKLIQTQLQNQLQNEMIHSSELSPNIHISSLIYETLSSVLIYNTKMYFFWIKCFHSDPSKRFICFL